MYVNSNLCYLSDKKIILIFHNKIFFQMYVVDSACWEVILATRRNSLLNVQLTLSQGLEVMFA